MDPDVVWQTMCAWDTETLEDRADAAAALLSWVDGGGYPPAGISKEATRWHCATVLAEAWRAR